MTVISSRTFYTEQVHNVTVVCFTVPSMVESTYEAVSDELFELVDYVVSSDPIQVVLDMSSVKSIDDWGLAMLRAFHETLGDRDGTVIICRLSQRIADEITRTGLDNLFDIRETRSEAVSSFEFACVR